MTLEQFIQEAILEDTQDPLGLIPSGDHSALACIPLNAVKSAQLIIKQDGILAGVDIATKIFKQIDSKFEIKVNINDGKAVKKGDIVLTVKGNARNLLLAERLVLNIMQRMSGIATTTNQYIALIKPYATKILDTRKTTPNFRYFEKLAVKIGGGFNHRFGLYDMIMLKDNHIDYCGGIEQAINQTNDYKLKNQLNLSVEIETRNLEEVAKVLSNQLKRAPRRKHSSKSKIEYTLFLDTSAIIDARVFELVRIGLFNGTLVVIEGVLE